MKERRKQVEALVASGTPLGVALSTVGLAKSTWFYRSRPRGPRALRPAVVAALRQVDGFELAYGYRKLTHWLRRQGLWINTKCVLRHTRALAMLQPKKRKGPRWTSLAPIHPTVPNTYWEADTTPVDTGEGRSWACVIVDPALGSAPVAGALSDRCRASEASAVLEAAVLEAFPATGRVPDGHELIVRVDRGGQFVATAFRQTAAALNVRLAYCGVQCPNDKPYIESFFSLYKTEEVYRNEYRTRAEARAGWARWRGWYLNERLHSRLGYRPPVEAQLQLAQVTA